MRYANRWVVTRRDFLKTSIAAGISATAFGSGIARAFAETGFRFGMVTDAHYADADPQFDRYYRESIIKITECIDFMNAQKVEFLIELGDFKDQNTQTIALFQGIATQVPEQHRVRQGKTGK